MNLLKAVRNVNWVDLERTKDRILSPSETTGNTTLGFPRHTYRYSPQHTEPEALFPVMASEKEDKPVLDLRKYGVKQIGQITADDEVLDVWIVDGDKIKKELDENWCGSDDE